jgi:hypothetical protein
MTLLPVAAGALIAAMLSAPAARADDGGQWVCGLIASGRTVPQIAKLLQGGPWCAWKRVPWRSWNPLKRTQQHCVGGGRFEGRRMGKHTAATADPATDYGSAHTDALCSKLAENPSFDGILAAQTPTVGDSVEKVHLTPYLVAIGAVAALACYPATAHADDASFLAAVQAAGLLSPDNTPSTALALGHQICDHITANGVAGVANTVELAHQAGIPPEAAGAMLRFSVNDLCPNDIAAANAWNGDTTLLPPQATPTPTIGHAAGMGRDDA